MTMRELHDTTPWWVKLLIPIILSAVISGAVSFSNTTQHNDRDLIQRVSALEAHRADDNSRLDRIESKIDHLIDNVKWALGSK